MTDRYYLAVSPKSRQGLTKKAQDYHTSISRLVKALGEVPWERTDPEASVDDWIRIGPRIAAIHIPFNREQINAYQKLAYELFLVSAVGSKEYIGLVLEAWLTGKVKPSEKLVFTEQKAKRTGSGSHNPSVQISAQAFKQLQKKLANEQVGRAVRDFLVKYPFPNWYTYEPAKDPIDRRRGRRVILPLEVVQHMARIGKHLKIKPDRDYVETSWAAEFLEGLGIGTIHASPQQQGTPDVLTRIHALHGSDPDAVLSADEV